MKKAASSALLEIGLGGGSESSSGQREVSCSVAHSQETGEYLATPDTVCLILPHPSKPGSKSTFSMRSSLAALALKILFPLKTLNSQSQTDLWHASVCLNPLWPEL